MVWFRSLICRVGWLARFKSESDCCCCSERTAPIKWNREGSSSLRRCSSFLFFYSRLVTSPAECTIVTCVRESFATVHGAVVDCYYYARADLSRAFERENKMLSQPCRADFQPFLFAGYLAIFFLFVFFGTRHRRVHVAITAQKQSLRPSGKSRARHDGLTGCGRTGHADGTGYLRLLLSRPGRGGWRVRLRQATRPPPPAVRAASASSPGPRSRMHEEACP